MGLATKASGLRSSESIVYGLEEWEHDGNTWRSGRFGFSLCVCVRVGKVQAHFKYGNAGATGLYRKEACVWLHTTRDTLLPDIEVGLTWADTAEPVPHILKPGQCSLEKNHCSVGAGMIQ